MDVREIAAFRSRRFVPILPEACQLEPGVHGAELAFWLAGKLAGQGVVTSYPVARDGCWILEYETQAGGDFELICTNIDGSDGYWRVALRRRNDGGFASGAASFGAAQALVNAIRFVLHAAVPKEEIEWRHDIG